jgi:type IV pilus assembly protein PilY1
MFKSNSKTKTLSVIGIAAMPAVLAGLAYAAAIFPPTTSPAIIGYVAQPVLSNFNLLSNTEKIYRGEYEKGAWSGNLSCYPVDNTGVVSLATPCWSAASAVGAASVVDKQGVASGSRNIATRTATGGAAFALAVSPTVLLDAAHVNFIRGDRSQEAPTGTLRTRASVLGDTIHSRPYYHADATNPTVFYGANDGMLHAIDATTGKERWAYIPSMLIPKLPALWTSPYAHTNFVDGNIQVSNVGTTALPQNILVGVLGSGGKGIYALDITTLTAASDTAVAAKSLWEITPATAGFANLGDTYSNPTVYPVETGVNAVIVGNGYNNTGNGQASLFVIDTKTGVLIREISTGSGTAISPNGLSTPVAIDFNNNGRADFAYAGDIDGNMWKFDMTSASPAMWSASLLYSTKSNAATPAGQAITMMPGVAKNPAGGYMVTFATGRILTATDQADTAAHYVYGIWDGAPASNTTLAAQTISVRPYGTPAINVRVVGTTPEGTTITPNYAVGQNKGWQARLPAGERVVGDTAFIKYGRFFFNATNPTTKFTPAGGAANTGSGENWLMALDYLTGTTATPFFDMNGDGVLDANDRIQYVAGDVMTAPKVAGSTITSNFGVPVGYATTDGVQSQPLFGDVGPATAIFYNQNFDGTPAAIPQPPPPGSTGVGNGHFDVDVSYNVSGSTTKFGKGGTDTHNHEYDKTYDTNGLNFLNPSDPALKFNATPGMTATTPYKVLVMNQAWNRAMTIKVGTDTWNTKDFQTGVANPLTQNRTGTYLATGQLDVAALPVYTGITSTVTGTTVVPATSTTSVPGKITVTTVSTTGSVGCGGMTAAGVPIVAGSGCTTSTITTGARDSVGGLEFAMPYDGFSIKDWWGDGTQQVGVMPTFYKCADSMNADGTVSTNAQGGLGPQGERHDGVLTVQIIRATTPNADVIMNVTGKPQYGFRVVDAKIASDVLAEYTLYWHHPMTTCMGDPANQAWTVGNNQGDPWWPAQATVNTPSTTGKVTKGLLTCVPKQQNGAKTAWKTTAPAATTPPSPASWWPATGWSMTPPPDLATTLPPCPIYSATADDPRNASFLKVTPSGGGGGTTPPPPPVVSVSTNLLGGAALGAIKPRVSCAAGSAGCTCVGTTCTKAGGGCTGAACNTPSCIKGAPGCPIIPPPPSSGRLSWRELLN